MRAWLVVLVGMGVVGGPARALEQGTPDAAPGAAPPTPAVVLPAPGPAPAPPVAETPASSPAPAAATEPLPEDDVTVSARALTANAERVQLTTLRTRLLELEREQADVDLVLPWTVFAIGTAALVVGTVLGLERATSCDASCSGPFWPSWMVVGGATVGALGLVWLMLEHEELSALRTRHYHLQNQIEAYELNRASLTPRLRLHAAF